MSELSGLDAAFQEDIHENVVPGGAKVNLVLILGLRRGVTAINFLTKGVLGDDMSIVAQFSIYSILPGTNRGIIRLADTDSLCKR
jgi:hypothetical protein